MSDRVKDARTAIEAFLENATTLLDGLEMLEQGEKPVEVVRKTLNRAKKRRRIKKMVKRAEAQLSKNESKSEPSVARRAGEDRC